MPTSACSISSSTLMAWRLLRHAVAHHPAEPQQGRAPVDLTVDLDVINGYHPLVHDPELHGRLAVDRSATGGEHLAGRV
jgi:hypothetical protein